MFQRVKPEAHQSFQGEPEVNQSLQGWTRFKPDAYQGFRYSEVLSNETFVVI